MKTYTITLKLAAGEATFRLRAKNLAAAQTMACAVEKAPRSALAGWSVVPTARQTVRTKSLMRGL